ncbi:MAG: hypothetical protein OEQ13_06760 [Acidobacteriota bacterium]|nr:hypothetical protein [Acidobacteriota bacterium]
MSLKRTTLLLLLLGLLMLGAFACSVFDDDEGLTPSPSASLLVYGTDDPGDVTSLNVELIDLRIYTDPDDATGTLLTPEGGSSIVDLVRAAESGTPGLFGEFEIMPGSYQCVSGTLRLANFTFEGGATACNSATNLPISSITTEKLCLPRPITINGGDRRDLVFDLPVISGSGTPPDDCQLQFDHARRRVMRLADM